MPKFSKDTTRVADLWFTGLIDSRFTCSETPGYIHGLYMVVLMELEVKKYSRLWLERTGKSDDE